MILHSATSSRIVCETQASRSRLRRRLTDYICGEREKSPSPRLFATCNYGIWLRFHGHFAYVTARLDDGDEQPLMRLRYQNSALHWGLAIYRASHDDYDESLLATGLPIGTPEEALDTAARLYINLHS